MIRNFKILFAVFAIIAISVAAYAFAAANTVPATRAGDGQGVVSGYTVSNVAYTLNAGDPSLLDNVAFTLDANALQAHVQLVPAGTWYACTGGPTAWTCNTTGLTVLSITQLRVVATGN